MSNGPEPHVCLTTAGTFMYWKQFGFKRSPFVTAADPERFFESSAQQEGLARLNFLVNEHRRGAIVTGLPGTGKTTLVREFARRAAQAGREIVVVDYPAFGTRELFYDLAQGLGLNPTDEQSEAGLWRGVRQAIRASRAHGDQIIIVVDQAELLLERPDGLHALHALFHLDPDPTANYAVIIVARPEAVARCRKELVECVDLSVIIEPFSQEETEQYIRHVSRWSGTDRDVFDGRALAAVHEITGGVPRRIDRICDLALVAAAAEQLDQVDEQTVRSVAHELSYAGGQTDRSASTEQRQISATHRAGGEAWAQSPSEI